MYPRKAVIDVNIPAIYLVEDHPGYEYVSTYIDKVLRHGTIVYALSTTPFRVLWILTKVWGIPKHEALEAVESFVKEKNVIYTGLSKQWVIKVFELSRKLHHDVYDCMYLSLALMVKADAIITTDTHFKKLAPRIGVKYINPVPEDIIKKFKEYRKD